MDLNPGFADFRFGALKSQIFLHEFPGSGFDLGFDEDFLGFIVGGIGKNLDDTATGFLGDGGGGGSDGESAAGLGLVIMVIVESGDDWFTGFETFDGGPFRVGDLGVADESCDYI